MTPWQKTLRLQAFCWLSFTLFGFLAYASALPNPFIFDDLTVIADNHWLRWELIPNFFRSFVHDSHGSFPGYRPLVMASFVVEKELWGALPWVMRTTNLLLHISISFLVFLLAQQFFRRTWPKQEKVAAYFVGLIFLLHPIQTSVITLVWNRSDLLVALGILGAFLACGRWWQKSKPAFGSLILFYVFTLIAIFSKESALILPAVILLGDLLLWRPRGAIRRRRVAIYLPLLAITAGHAWLIFVTMPQTLSSIGFKASHLLPSTMVLDRWTYLLTQATGLLEYFRVLIFPAHLNVFHHLRPVQNLTEVRFLSGMGLLGGVLGLAFFYRKRESTLTFGFLWFLLLLVPSSSLISLHLPFDEDRLYLPLIGLLCVAVYAWLRIFFFFKSKNWNLGKVAWQIAPAILLIFYLSFDHLRCRVWRNPIALWSQNVLDYPQDARAWLALGEALAQEKKAKEAVMAYRKAMELEPSYALPHFKLGIFFLDLNQPQRARAELTQAFALGKFRSEVLHYMGEASVREKDPAQAVRFFLLSLSQNQEYIPALRSLAQLLAEEANVTEALRAFQLALYLDPHNPWTQLDLAEILWRKNVDPQRGRATVEAIAQKNPTNLRAHTLLGEMQVSPKP